MLKVVFIGSVHFSKMALNHISLLPYISLVGIVTCVKTKTRDDHVCLEADAQKLSIDSFIYKNNDSDLTQWIARRAPDVIYCFGWPNLLSKDIFGIPRIGTIGYHPTALPKNRGRHPIIWSLALGLTSTGSTFFFIDEGIDSGDILSQVELSISIQDNAESLYDKLINIALEQITEFSQQLITHQYNRLPQEHSEATYWRKRTAKDGVIDWRMTATAINNLVRALSRPYPGAICTYNSSNYKIWKSNIIEFVDNSTEPGKVLKNTRDNFTVKCGENALEIIEHNFSEIPMVGAYL